MPAPKLRWYTADDTALAGAVSIEHTAGIPTTAVQRNLWNDKGGSTGSDDANELRIFALSRDTGVGYYSVDDEIAANGWIEVRAIGSGGPGAPPVQTTPWTPVGRGRFLHLRVLPSDGKREIEIRLNVPAGAGTGTSSKEILLRALAGSAASVVDEGHHETTGGGVCHGVGDGRYSALLEGGTLTATGTPDDEVHLDLTSWIYKGVPYCKLTSAIEITNLDGAAAALTSGKSYWAALTLKNGTVTQTKSVMGTSPLSVSLRPTLPADEPLLGYVEREYDATIESGDIYQDERVYGWFGFTSSGLNPTLGAGWAMLDNRMIVLDKPTTLTALTASDDNYIWLNPGGSMESNITGDAPEPRSKLLYIATTDGSAVTALQDLRSFVGKPIRSVSFKKAGTLASSDKVYAVWPSNAPGYLLPLHGVTLALGDDGGTSGSTKADIEQSAAGGAFTTLFTSSGTDDQRPDVAYNSTTATDTGARPEVTRIEPRARLRTNLIAVPGTASTDQDLELLVVEV